jgi:hypothetical protein
LPNLFRGIGIRFWGNPVSFGLRPHSKLFFDGGITAPVGSVIFSI